ncbi:MAG TPA: STAS domain-containing protein [Sphingobacteriaceae bacterium]
MTNLKITERRIDPVTILDLEGNIRLGEGSAELRQALRLLVEKGDKKILLNMAGVSHIDSSGLGELVSSYTTLHKADGELKLVHLSSKVHELMTMTKLLTVFDVFDSESEALESFTGKSPKSVFASTLM